MLGRCGGLERTDFYQFLIWEEIEVLKELIYNSFFLGGNVEVLIELINNSFYPWEGVVVPWKNLISDSFNVGSGVVALKELIFINFYFGRKCGGLERTDF